MELLKPGHGWSNSQLTAAQIPDPDGNLSGWVHFAHSFNGYEYAGSLEACAAIANGGKASSLSELRCALFFEARRDRHSGGYTDVTPTVRGLLRQIKAKVEQQEQTGGSTEPKQAEPQ